MSANASATLVQALVELGLEFRLNPIVILIQYLLLISFSCSFFHTFIFWLRLVEKAFSAHVKLYCIVTYRNASHPGSVTLTVSHIQFGLKTLSFNKTILSLPLELPSKNLRLFHIFMLAVF